MTSWIRKVFNTSKEEMPKAPESESQDLAEAAGDEDEGQLALDVYQDKDNVIVKSTIAGVKPEDLDITLSSDNVIISGERRQEEEVKDEDYFYQECYWGGFSRSLALPVEVDVDGAEAEIKDGILTLTLPKAGKTRTKKVKVRSEDKE